MNIQKKAADKIRELFNTDCDVYFVFNGTSANSLALSSLCNSYQSVICHEMSHIETDECGSPEFFSNGIKLHLVSGENGKIDLSAVEKSITWKTDIHYPRPKILSITQATELGTVYTVAELKKIHELSLKYNLKIHMDGARFSNAVASLNIHPGEITWKVGVNVLCFGGAKNGMAVGEAIVFFNRELSVDFDFRCKQSGQLASKMRFLSAPWIDMLESDKWLENAKIANHYAQLLKDKLGRFSGIEIIYPREANSIFVKMPEKISEGLKNKGWHFYNFIGTGFSRFMYSWNTKDTDVNNLVDDIKELI